MGLGPSPAWALGRRTRCPTPRAGPDGGQPEAICVLSLLQPFLLSFGLSKLCGMVLPWEMHAYCFKLLQMQMD